MREERLRAELELIRTRYQGAEYKDGWFRIPGYPLPAGWSQPEIAVAFPVDPGYPATRPYGLYVPLDLKFKDAQPQNFTPASNNPPFPGSWGVMSWHFRDEAWKPAADLRKGSTLLMFVDGFRERFAEGV